MKRGLAWTFHGATLALFATGAALTWWVYGPVEAAPPEEEFFAAQSPWQAPATAVHVVVAPLLLFLVGLIWRHHIAERWRNRGLERRRTGLVLVILFPLMCATGYLLQVAESETLRVALGWSHAISGIAFGLVYLAHQFGPKPQPLDLEQLLRDHPGG